MISYIRGEVLFRNENSVVIDVNGIGYEVWVTYPVMCALERASGTVELYTYTHVKEDMIALYGFMDKQDLRTFKLLITVSGIGPKGALAIMSSLSTRELILCVLADDSKTIAKAPGIGAKTAAKLVLELKDKFSLDDTLGDSDSFRTVAASNEAAASAATGANDDIKNETVMALVALGYSSSEALKAVRAVKDSDNMNSQQLLKASLKNI